MGRAKQAYGFKYDDLDRLTESKYFDIIDNNQQSSTFSTDYKFNESSSYDLRGNITNLKRNGLNGGSWTSNGYTAATYGMIDNLGYIYNSQNQVTKVVDTSLANKGFIYKNASVSTAFTYDSNGNLTSDANKGITSIEYNYLNLPIKIVFNRTFQTSYNNGSIEFIYDATGVKLRKTVKDVNGNVLDTRDYVNGVEYNNGTLSRIAHTEGSVARNEFGAYEHQYALRDHLGNTRVTFRDGVNKGDAYFDWNTYTYVDPNYGNTTGLNDGTITSADIMQINHYYPFGLNMEGNWNGSQGGNKYQYNGKELNSDFGLEWNDYGARFYDPAIGRWEAVDPLAEKYVNMSPFNYTLDNPIRFIDPNGKFVIEGNKEEKKVLKQIVSMMKKEMNSWGKEQWGEVKNVTGMSKREFKALFKNGNGPTIKFQRTDEKSMMKGNDPAYAKTSGNESKQTITFDRGLFNAVNDNMKSGGGSLQNSLRQDSKMTDEQKQTYIGRENESLSWFSNGTFGHEIAHAAALINGLPDSPNGTATDPSERGYQFETKVMNRTVDYTCPESGCGVYNAFNFRKDNSNQAVERPQRIARFNQVHPDLGN